VYAIREYVLIDTPYVKYKTALATLEKAGRLTVTKAYPNRRPYTYADEKWHLLHLRFA
jgi:hypothetical protein